MKYIVKHASLKANVPAYLYYNEELAEHWLRFGEVDDTWDFQIYIGSGLSFADAEEIAKREYNKVSAYIHRVMHSIIEVEIPGDEIPGGL